MPETFTAGDRVYVTDPALAEMRAIMSRFGHEAKPNHYGTVDAIWDGDMVLINFDDGVGAPYPLDMVRHLDTPSPA